MDKRPLPLSLRQWLLDEVDLWRRSGLVSDAQSDAILDLYETPRQSSARHQSIAIYALVSIAATFVGLAVLLLVGYNWDLLPDAIKLGALFGAIVGAYGLAFGLRYGWRKPIFSECAFLLGALFYGGAIALIGEIFHLGDHPPDGVWWWALGVMPLALFLDTFVLHVLVVTLLALWVGMETTDAGHLAPFGPFAGWLRGCVTLPVFVAAGLAWAYGKKSPTVVGLYVALVAWWLIMLPFAWSWNDNPLLFIGAVGALLLIAAQVHADGSPFAAPYRLLGALLCMGVLSILSFFEMQRDLTRIQSVGPFVIPTLVVTTMSGLLFAIALYVHWRSEGVSYVQPVVAFAVREWLPLSIAALMLLMTGWYALMKVLGINDHHLIATPPTIVANGAMLVLAFWLMMFGLREERGFPSAGGVVFFLLWSVLRYSEWFADRGGMLGASCMFFLCGAAIFAFAMFWYRRRHQRETHPYEREQS